jgi:oligosaccharide repeat unit polymerase
MSAWTAIIILFLVAFFVVSKKVFHYRINAISVLVLSWGSALVLSSLDINFKSSHYQYLSDLDNSLAYFLIFFSFISIAFGYTVGCKNRPMRSSSFIFHINAPILNFLFFSILSLYLYTIISSGTYSIIFMSNLDALEVHQMRINRHLGSINHLILGINFLAANYLYKFFRSRKKIYLVPILILFVTHLATMQKSPVVNFVLQMTFVYFLTSDKLLTNTRVKILKIISLAILSLFASYLFLLSNEVRGIGLVQHTSLSPILEQFFIYLGGPSILNFSATVSEVIPTANTFGMLILQSLAWIIGYREFYDVTQFLGGINNGTALMYWWADLGFFGIFYHGFFLGFLVGFFHVRARNNILMAYFSALLYQFLAMSQYTEFLYSPTILLTVLVVLFLNFFLRSRVGV